MSTTVFMSETGHETMLVICFFHGLACIPFTLAKITAVLTHTFISRAIIGLPVLHCHSLPVTITLYM